MFVLLGAPRVCLECRYQIIGGTEISVLAFENEVVEKPRVARPSSHYDNRPPNFPSALPKPSSSYGFGSVQEQLARNTFYSDTPSSPTLRPMNAPATKTPVSSPRMRPMAAPKTPVSSPRLRPMSSDGRQTPTRRLSPVEPSQQATHKRTLSPVDPSQRATHKRTLSPTANNPRIAQLTRQAAPQRVSTGPSGFSHAKARQVQYSRLSRPIRCSTLLRVSH